MEHVSITHHDASIYRKNVPEGVFVDSSKNNFAFLVELSLKNILSLEVRVFHLLLIHRPIFIKPFVKFVAKPKLVFNTLIEPILELYFVTRVFLENVIAHTQNKLPQILIFVCSDVNDDELSQVRAISVVIGICHAC